MLKEGHSGGQCGRNVGRGCQLEGKEASQGEEVALVPLGGIRKNQHSGQQGVEKNARIALGFKIHA